jgi:hypothetical protein
LVFGLEQSVIRIKPAPAAKQTVRPLYAREPLFTMINISPQNGAQMSRKIVAILLIVEGLYFLWAFLGVLFYRQVFFFEVRAL